MINSFVRFTCDASNPHIWTTKKSTKNVHFSHYHAKNWFRLSLLWYQGIVSKRRKKNHNNYINTQIGMRFIDYICFPCIILSLVFFFSFRYSTASSSSSWEKREKNRNNNNLLECMSNNEKAFITKYDYYVIWQLLLIWTRKTWIYMGIRSVICASCNQIQKVHLIWQYISLVKYVHQSFQRKIKF